MTTTTNPVSIEYVAGHNFGGYCKTNANPCPTGNLMIDSSGKITTNFSPTQHTSAATWYAIWTRNFTCAATSSTTNYMGKQWYTLNNNDTNGTCELILNSTVGNSAGNAYDSSTGTTEGNVYSYISSYTNGTDTLSFEKGAGLVTDINSASTDANPLTGVYWVEPGGIYDSHSHTTYTGNQNPITVYTGGCIATDGAITCMSTDRKATYANTGCISDTLPGNMVRSVSSSSTTYSVSEGSCTSNTISNYRSKSWTWYKPTQWNSSSSFRLTKEIAGEYTAQQQHANQNRVQIYQCGGDYHNQHVYSIASTSTTNTVQWKNIIANTTTNRLVSNSTVALYAGAAVSTTTSTSEGVTRTYNHGSSNSATTDERYKCKNDFKYSTASNSTKSYPIYYRPHIVVKK